MPTLFSYKNAIIPAKNLDEIDIFCLFQHDDKATAPEGFHAWDDKPSLVCLRMAAAKENLRMTFIKKLHNHTLARLGSWTDQEAQTLWRNIYGCHEDLV